MATTTDVFTAGSATTSGGSPNAAVAKSYVPALIAPSTVTSPARLNQAVTQPQARPPRMEPQWYRPPAVGKADATWAMVAATVSENRQTSGQPSPMPAPPAPPSPTWNEVIPPARMQMIDSEMAKLEKADIRRANSWA